MAALWGAAGMSVIDLDALSRAVLDVPGDGVEEAVARFGEEMRTAAGTIDRRALGAVVFADSAARADLEDIVLSRVEIGVARAEQDAAAHGHSTIVHDSPLLLEKHQDARYDAIVGVLARREDRIARIVRDRGRDRAYAEAVMAAQVTDRERIRRCTHLVLNTADRGTLARRSGRVLAALGLTTGPRP